MAKSVACIIARTVSTRLPLKVLRTVSDNLSILDYIIQRLKMVSNIDDIYICTSNEPSDDILEDTADKNNVQIYRGSADKVIERMLAVGQITNADNLIRITGDNVFTSYEYISKQIEALNQFELDYVRLIDVPIGSTAEVMKRSALEDCYLNMDPSVSEYLLLYMFNPQKYKCGVAKVLVNDYSGISITVDTPADFKRTKNILSFFEKEKHLKLTLSDIINTIVTNNIPDSFIQPSGFVKMPYEKQISFKEFKDDMNKRISSSYQLKF